MRTRTRSGQRLPRALPRASWSARTSLSRPSSGTPSTTRCEVLGSDISPPVRARACWYLSFLGPAARNRGARACTRNKSKTWNRAGCAGRRARADANARARARTHAHTNARTNARTHARTHTPAGRAGGARGVAAAAAAHLRGPVPRALAHRPEEGCAYI